MELLAYTHAAATYEDSIPVEWRSPCELLSTIPSSAWLGVASMVAFAAIVGGAEAAEAALCQYGDNGHAVSELQQALQSKGYYEAQVDGLFGPLTDTGVRQFQQSSQLVVDGKAGNHTLNALGLGDSIGTVFSTDATCNAGGGGGGGGTPAAGVARVTTRSNPLLVRSQPTTTSPDIAAIPNGTDVPFSDVSADGTWLYAPSYGGWINARYTTYGAGSGGGAPEPDRGRVRIATQTKPLNVRSEASLSSSVLTTIAKDTLVNYSRVTTQGEGAWLYLPAYGGWVASQYTTYASGGGGGAPSDGTERSGSVAIATRYNPLIVRSQPTTASQPINALAKGTQTNYSRVASNDAGETWLYVPQYSGWISARYTTYRDSAASPTATSAAGSPSGRTPTEAAPEITSTAPSPAPEATPAPTVSPTTEASPSAVAPSPAPTASVAPSPEAVAPVEPTETPAIAEEVGFEVAELARIAPAKADLFSTPGATSGAIATIEKGTFVSFTKRATLDNGANWYFAPSFNGWIQESELEFISIDFAD